MDFVKEKSKRERERERERGNMGNKRPTENIKQFNFEKVKDTQKT